MGKLLLAVLAWVLASAVSPVFAQLPTHGADTRALLFAGDFAALERLYLAETESVPATRGPGVEMASVYFFHSMKIGATPASWVQDDKATRAWLEGSPASVPAAIARASALASRADTLDRAGDWAGVETLLREQERLLTAIKPKATKDMAWHTLYLGLGRQQGWPAARIRTAVEAGMDVDPTSMNLYEAAGRALAPAWRGSAEPLDWLARLGASRTAPNGAATYAQIRLRTARLIETVFNRPFEDGLIDWELMNQGMTQLYRRNPSPSTLNQHAALACRAGDKGTTAALLARIGTRVFADQWKRWGGVSHFENCKTWAEWNVLKS